MSTAPATMNPFPGLRPFTREEDYLFFGREEQTLELLARLGSHRFVAVVGSSGSGKSSLVRCGLLSELLGGKMMGAGASWEIAVTHPGGNPMALLTDALLQADLYDRVEEHARENLLATLSRSHFGLIEAVKQAGLSDDTNFLLVVDQFEEIFRFHETGQTQQEMANEFVSLLLEAVEQKDVPIYVVLTMRSDFIGECGQFEGLAEMVNRGEFLIPRLTREQFKRVIEGPVKVAGGQIAPRLLQRLLNDLGQQADQLPCLQHALMRTWNVWTEKRGEGELDLDDYQRVGRMSEALSLHADEIFDSLASDRQRELCAGTFKALTVQESENRGIRRPQRLGRLSQILDVGAGELLPIIDAYRRHGVTFLMPSPEVELTDRTIIDISHESLMRVWTRLRHWVEEEAQAAGIYLRLSESAALQKRGQTGLYRDPELGIALAWQESQKPNAAWAERYHPGFDVAMAFLAASREAGVAEEQAREDARQRELEQARQLAEAQQQRLEQQQRAARRLRQLIAGLAVVALIAGLACVAALIANQRANTQAENARRNEEKANQSASEAKQAQQEADQARAASEKSREAAQAEAYRAVLSEARALRAGREPGWRDDALADLARLASSPSPRRDLLELRTEAVAALGTPDIRLIAQIQPPNGVHSFAFGDGQALFTVGPSGELDLWNVQQLKHAAYVEELDVARTGSWAWEKDQVLSLPRGQGLAVATRDQGVVFIDTTGKPICRPPITRGTHSPTQLSVDSMGSRIAVNWADGAGITVHDLASGEILGEFSNFPCALSPDGQWLARQGPQSEVLLQRIGVKEPDRSLGRHEGGIHNFAFSPDGSTLGSTSHAQTATLWDVAGRKQPVVLRGHREAVNELAFSPDGRWVATASNDFTARIWDVLTGQCLATLPGPWFMQGVRWSPDGAFLAVRANTEWVYLYRVTGRRIYERLAMHRYGVQCVTASPRPDRFATGADDHLVIDWDLSSAQPSRRWAGEHPQWVTVVAYSPDGSLLASGTGEGILLVRDAETGETKARLTGQTMGVYALAFDPSGRRLASGDRNGRVIVWDLATQKPAQQFQVGPSWVWSIAFLDDGRKLVSEVSNGRVVLFDIQSGKEEAQITLPGGIRRFIADPARKRLVVAFNNGDLCSLSTPDLTPGHRLEHAHPSAIESLALSPDGRLLATGGADRRVVFRDPVTFEPLLAFPEWTAMVKDLAFTHSGRHLAYVGADSDIALWDLTLLHEGLEAVGLTWDRPVPTIVATTSPDAGADQRRPAVPIIRDRAATADPVGLEQARRLVRSGVGAFQGGRWADAIRDLRQASDRLRTLHQAAPRDGRVASQLGISLGFLGSALKNEHRLAEALASFKEEREVLEAIRHPSSLDLYNLACTYSQLTIQVEPGSESPTAAEREALADQAMAKLRRSVREGMTDFAQLERDHDLDALRERPDFRALLLELTGGTRETVADLAALASAKPEDTVLSLKVAALQAWFGQDKELAATRQRLLAFAKGTKDSGTAERVAKACSIVPCTDKTELEAALALGHAGASLDRREWTLLALGMAEYRSGNFAAADEALLAAAQAGKDVASVTGISAFYRALSLFRLGKEEEARKMAIAANAKMKPLPKDENTPLLGGNSYDDLILWLAYKEAKAMIKFESITPPKAENDKK